jgi:hypothetical protein
MATDENTKSNQTSARNFCRIVDNLVATDKDENHFLFSQCRNRNIVVLGSQKTSNYIVGDIIRRDTYNHPYYQPRKDEQNTITYVMAPGDTACNVCIVNLIDIPPIEYYVKRSEKNRKDSTPSPMAEIDRTIYKFATNIDLIVLVCGATDFELMKNMKKWASNRGHIMALAVIGDPRLSPQYREEFIRSIRDNKEFIDNGLDHFFHKGIFCISDLSFAHFQNSDEHKLAQALVKSWRSNFLRTCVGGPNDGKYEIVLHEDKQSHSTLPCKPF